MITNFEEITVDLTENELLLVNIFVNKLSKLTKENPMKSHEIVKRHNEQCDLFNVPQNKIDGVKLRKICNAIRSQAMMPLIATSKGYYVSRDVEEIKKQILSLEQRARSIMQCAKGLEKYL